MNKYVLPLVFAAATVALRTSFASTPPPPSSVNHAAHYVGYFQQDADSDVQTDSDSTGDYDVFYDRLASDGQWLQTDDYGYVWQPNVAASSNSWRPYSDGHWVWTDRGWFWDSNENFGWATYHYGRWVLVDGTGWVWMPGKQWAPAWVSWRHTDSDDYVGWAPLPPESSFNVNVGVHPWCDGYYDIGPSAFAFIRIGDFGRPSYRGYWLPPEQNLGFFNRTTNITNITYNNNVINNFGPQYERVSQLVQQRGGQQIPTYRINYAAQTQANAAFKASVQGNQLNVVAPPQTLRASATLKPQVARELGKSQVDRGWRNVPQTQAQQVRQQYVQQTPVPPSLPAKPVLPAKPQIQTATKGEQHPSNALGKGQPTPASQLKPFVEKPENKPNGEQKKPEAAKAGPVQPQNVQPAETLKKPVPENEAVGEPKKPEAPKARPVQPQNVQPAETLKKPVPENEAVGEPKKPEAPKTRPVQPQNVQPAETLKKPVPENETVGEPKRPEAAKARPVQPESVQPAETPKKPVGATEEKKAGTEGSDAEKARTNNQVRRDEGERTPQNLESKPAREAEKPAGHREPGKRKPEDTKKEPPAQP
jgi:hypothetical protein